MLVVLAAGLWRGLGAQLGAEAAPDLGSRAHLLGGGKRQPGLARRVSSGEVSGSSGRLEGAGSGALGGGGDALRRSVDGASSGAEQPQEGGGHSVLLMGASSDGCVWQLQLPLLAGTLADPKSPLPPGPKPELLGLLHMLPQRVTSFAVGPVPVPLPGATGALVPVASATAAGTIEIAAVQQGPLLPLHLGVSASLAAHPAPIQVRLLALLAPPGAAGVPAGCHSRHGGITNTSPLRPAPRPPRRACGGWAPPPAWSATAARRLPAGTRTLCCSRVRARVAASLLPSVERRQAHVGTACRLVTLPLPPRRGLPQMCATA